MCNETPCTEEKLPRVLTVVEAGQELRVGRSAAYALVHSGKLRSIRVGKCIRIPREAVEAFLSAH